MTRMTIGSGGTRVEVANFEDDGIWALGEDSDAVFTLRSSTLAANTPLANVLVGTPDAEALAANSLIISNTTLNGDMSFCCNNAGNSQQFMWFDASANTLYFEKICDFDTTVFFDGAVDIKSSTSGLRIKDDIFAGFGDGRDFQIKYETADADAKILLFTCDESDDSGNNVPVWAFAEETNTNNVNLNLFDAFIQPLVTVVDNDADSWFGITFTADDVPSLSCGGAATTIGISAPAVWTNNVDSSAVANTMTISAYEFSAGNRGLAVGAEAAVTISGDIASTHTFPIRYNGVTYNVLCSNA